MKILWGFLFVLISYWWGLLLPRNSFLRKKVRIFFVTLFCLLMFQGYVRTLDFLWPKCFYYLLICVFLYFLFRLMWFFKTKLTIALRRHFR